MQAEFLIGKKLSGQELQPDELKWLMSEWLRGRITDAGMREFLRAARKAGLTFGEMLGIMHLAMISDELMDLRSLAGPKVQLHSINGVGERVSLMAGAICSAVGIPMVILSGPGLGCSISPLDKLQTVPGYDGKPDNASFLFHARRQRFAVIDTPIRLAPAATRLYQICEVDGLMSPVPFFAPLEMARVLTGGADAILLDVPFGEGCIVETENEAVVLARTMCALGEAEGKQMAAIVSHMEVLPGTGIGSVPEFADAVFSMDGRGDVVLEDIAVDIASRMLFLAGKGNLETCRMRAQRVVDNGVATDKLLDMAEEQGGEAEYLDQLEYFPAGCCQHSIRARKNGWIKSVSPARLEQAAIALKAVRALPGDKPDPKACIIFRKQYGDYVKKGEELAVLCAAQRGHFTAPAELVRGAFGLGNKIPPPLQFIHAWIAGTEVELIPPPEEEKAPITDNVIHPDFNRGESD